MTNLNIPNTLTNGTTADATDVQQNFDSIETHVNTELVNRDGTIPMTGELLLSGSPTAPLGAATKGYVDNLESSINSSIAALTSSSIAEVGTLTWDQQIVGTVTIPSGQAPPSPTYAGTDNSITINPSDQADQSLISRSPASFFTTGPFSPAIQYNYVTENAQYFFVAKWNWGYPYISAVGASSGNTYDQTHFYYKVSVGGATVTNFMSESNMEQVGLWTELDKTSSSGIGFYPSLQYWYQPSEDINVTVTWTDGWGYLMLYKMFSFE
jgi:hypothetical protein